MSGTAFVELLVAALVVIGAAFVMLGSLGLARFPDFYMRLHGPSKATTLGIGCLLIAALLYFASRGVVTFHEVMFTLFVALTTPVSAHLLARAARHRRLPDLRGTDPGLREGPPRDAPDGGDTGAHDTPPGHARTPSGEPRPPGAVQ